LAGETKPYRFLLRMSDELRRRLVESAERSGKSLNREIVERLEDSLS
jgi:predicted HicB family RNase H-like nuclease